VSFGGAPNGRSPRQRDLAGILRSGMPARKVSDETESEGVDGRPQKVENRVSASKKQDAPQTRKACQPDAPLGGAVIAL